MKGKSFIKYIVIIIIILVVIFLSQQAYFRGTERTFISDAASQASAYLSKGSDWVMSNVYPKISGEVQKRGEIIQTEVNKEKNKVSENITTKIGNYFSGITESILHPGENNNCQTQPSQTLTSP